MARMFSSAAKSWSWHKGEPGEEQSVVLFFFLCVPEKDLAIQGFILTNGEIQCYN